MKHKHTNEDVFEVNWHGPYKFEELDEFKNDDPSFVKALSLYAYYSDHPLYGKNCLTYIGKSKSRNEKRTVIDRLKEHDLENERIYVGIIYNFHGWTKNEELYKANWEEQLSIPEYLVQDRDTVSKIEELMIYALWPAGNSRNTKSAKNSESLRIFNTGDLGDLPKEISGFYEFARKTNIPADED